MPLEAGRFRALRGKISSWLTEESEGEYDAMAYDSTQESWGRCSGKNQFSLLPSNHGATTTYKFHREKKVSNKQAFQSVSKGLRDQVNWTILLFWGLTSIPPLPEQPL